VGGERLEKDMTDALAENGFAAPSPAPPPVADTMLGYFLTTLDVRVMRIEPRIIGDATKAALLAAVKKGLEQFTTRFPTNVGPENHSAWAEAYRLERIMALIEPAENLIAELKRRVAEAIEEKVSTAARLAATAEATYPLVIDTMSQPPALKAGGEEIVRAMLLDTLEEIHWNAQRKFYSAPIQKIATNRIVFAGLSAFVLFLLPYLAVYIELFAGREPSWAQWSGLPLYTAVTAGLFGAFFSRLLFLQRQWNVLTLGEITDARDWTSILLRGCVGTAGAVIVYFFLQSDIMKGSLFPSFHEISFGQSVARPGQPDNLGGLLMQSVYPNTALALLVVWCFLAGFSERLVPSILESAETTIGKSGGAIK
jgi:hypothetical protein